LLVVCHRGTLPNEKQFAELLSAAVRRVQSQVHFNGELNRFVRAFPTGKSKPAELALQLKAALACGRGICHHEICFVATDSRMKDAGMLRSWRAATLGRF